MDAKLDVGNLAGTTSNDDLRRYLRKLARSLQ